MEWNCREKAGGAEARPPGFSSTPEVFPKFFLCAS